MPDGNDIVLLGGLRTPFAKYGGRLTSWSSVDIGAFLLPRALEAVGVKPDGVDLLVCGTAFQAEVANHTNITARQVVLQAGLSATVVSYTVDQASCSGMMSVALARQALVAGDADVAVAMGTEALGEAPFLLPASLRRGQTRGDFHVRDPLFPMRFPARPGSLVEEVDHESEIFGVSRDDMDSWAQESQRRYQAAKKRGFFGGEIAAMDLADGTSFFEDEPPRPTSDLEKLGALPTVHGSSFVTAGNAPGMESGAAAIVLTTRRRADEIGITPLARLAAAASVAGEVSQPLSQTARAVERLVTARDIDLKDVDILELEEAFAAVVPISARYLDMAGTGDYESILQRSNPNGGAIACGHPIGASGVRLVLTLGRQVAAQQSLGVAALAGGLSQGGAMLMAPA